MKIRTSTQKLPVSGLGNRCGMTLVEVVAALAITGLAVGGVISGYTYCTMASEKAAITLAANARAMERLEETRSARWDTATWPIVDEVVSTNFPSKSVTLDLSGSVAITTKATINTSISQISANPPLKLVRVDCIWNFRGKEVITNTIATCRAPDQ